MVGNRGAGLAGDVLYPSPGDGVGVRAELDLQRHGGYTGCFSACPPNSLRMADSSLPANTSRPRDPKRAYSAAVRVGAGTPTSTAAIDVHRPSPESETRPANSSSSGEA